MGPILIQNSSQVALYEQIVRQVKDHILTGALEAGELLPSIRALAKDLQVSIITTKRAYEELEGAGFLTTVAGKGTFVARQDPTRLRERRIQEMETLLETAVGAAKGLGLTLEELTQTVGVLYEEVGK